MASKEKQNANKIREQVRRQFSAQLKEKDARIAELISENKTLSEQARSDSEHIRALEEEKLVTTEWLTRMQDYVNLSEEEMQEVRKSLSTSREAREAAERLSGLFGIFSRFGAAMPAFTGIYPTSEITIRRKEPAATSVPNTCLSDICSLYVKAGKEIQAHKGDEFHPDLHIYLDTSGSISEKQYSQKMHDFIEIAKVLGVKLFFHSFSHELSIEAELEHSGHTVQETYDAFRKLTLMSGGTDYTLVWDCINRGDMHKYQVSVMITDFEWLPDPENMDLAGHPEFLYYLPIERTDNVRRSMEEFIDNMSGGCPGIREHILMGAWA